VVLRQVDAAGPIGIRNHQIVGQVMKQIMNTHVENPVIEARKGIRLLFPAYQMQRCPSRQACMTVYSPDHEIIPSKA